MSRSRASILILSLWSLCFMSTIAVITGGLIRQKAQSIKRLEERQRLRPIAEAGITRARALLAKRPAQAYCALSDELFNSQALFRRQRLGEGSYSLVGEALQGVAVCYGLVDENRKININLADASVLRRLMTVVLGSDEMEAQELAASIIDWRDQDSQLSIPIGSAETSHYEGLAQPYAAKDAPLQRPEELLLVKGVSPDVFRKLLPFVTVYGDGTVNINTCSATVLRALGVDEELAEKVMRFRRGEDGIEGTEDDGLFESVSGVAERVSAVAQLVPQESALLATVAGRYLGVSAQYFSAESRAQLPGRAEAFRARAVFDMAGTVVCWQES